MARDPRTLSRMISRGEPPETMEDVRMLFMRLAMHFDRLDREVAVLRAGVLRLLEEAGQPLPPHDDERPLQ